jgi:hypothetical protein
MSHTNGYHLDTHQGQDHESESMAWLTGIENAAESQKDWMQSLSGVLTTAHNEKEVVSAIVHTALHLRGLDEHVERLTPIIAEAAMADKAVLSAMLKLGDQVLKQTLQ